MVLQSAYFWECRRGACRAGLLPSIADQIQAVQHSMVAPSIHFLVLSPVFKAYRAQYTNFAYWDVFKQLCTIPSGTAW